MNEPAGFPRLLGTVPITNWRELRCELRLMFALLVLMFTVRLLPRYREGGALRIFFAVLSKSYAERRMKPEQALSAATYAASSSTETPRRSGGPPDEHDVL